MADQSPITPPDQTGQVPPRRQAAPVSAQQNKRTGLHLGLIVLAMIGLSFAAVPLYRIFCQVTGYDGTPQRVSADALDGVSPNQQRHFTIHFDANVNPGLGWSFEPVQNDLEVTLGEPVLSFYRAHNRTARTVVGQASFNVTPEKVAKYFNKVECFCFTEQSLVAGQSIDMPVQFFIDPKIQDDPDLADVTHITLSYTFFDITNLERRENPPVAAKSRSLAN